MNKEFKFFIVIGVILISCLLGYYVLIAAPKSNNDLLDELNRANKELQNIHNELDDDAAFSGGFN